MWTSDPRRSRMHMQRKINNRVSPAILQ
jgi:hypothetical protein